MNLKNVVKVMLPTRARQSVRDAQWAFRFFKSIPGIFPRECPACNYRGMFRAFGVPPRYDALCPNCGSLERHRLVRLALNKHPLPTDANIIHFAPEDVVAAMVQNRNYRTADIMPGRADLVLDLNAIALPDQSTDVVILNHVLEHVPDASQALAELFRILRSGGLAIVTIPLIEGWTETYQNADIVSSEDRELHFGQRDHVRYFGQDFRDKVRGAGFILQEFVCSGAECAHYGLIRGERVFMARR